MPIRLFLFASSLLYFSALNANTFSSEVLKSLSYFEPSISMFDWHETNIDSSIDDGFAQIHEFRVQEKGSVVVVRQGFELDESQESDVQIWVMAGREIESADFDGYLAFSFLICDTETLLLIRELPHAGDTVHHCELTDEVPSESQSDRETEPLESRVKLRLRGEESFSQTYVLDRTTRSVQLNSTDAADFEEYVLLHGTLAVTASIEVEFANSVLVQSEIAIASNFEQDWLSPAIGGDDEDPASSNLVPFTPVFVSEDWDGPSLEAVRLRLQDTYNVLMPAFKVSRLSEPVHIERVDSMPSIQSTFVGGKKVHLIRLATGQYRFQQYTYQFARHLGAILTNYDELDNRSFEWLDESLSELASAYTILQFVEKPPRSDFSKENWQSYFDATYNEWYDGQLIDEYGILKTDKVSSWFPQHREKMRADSGLRPLNWGVARELLPFFLADDSAWEAAGYLNLWHSYQDETIYDYFRSWRKVLRVNRVPDRLIDHLESVFPPEETPAESTIRRREFVGLIPELVPPELDPVGNLGASSHDQRNERPEIH